MTTAPDQKTIANIFSELQRLGVPMAGWWAEPHCEETGEPAYGMSVAPEDLTDSDATWMRFGWDAKHGWTFDEGCDPPIFTDGVLVLDIPDPFDVPAVAEHLRKVVAGEIDEFRRAAA